MFYARNAFYGVFLMRLAEKMEIMKKIFSLVKPLLKEGKEDLRAGGLTTSMGESALR